MSPSRRSLAAAALAVFSVGCASAPGSSSFQSMAAAPTFGAGSGTSSPSTTTSGLPGAVSNHVIVISVDGLRPDAIEHFEARTLTRMIGEGSASLRASTILPSKTLPSHTSMLTGTEPEEHGVYWNSEQMDEHGHVATPTIFAAAKTAGLQTAAFFSKAKFEHLASPGTIDHAHFPGGFFKKDLAAKTTDAVEAYLMKERPNLLFVHLGDPDFAGHALGWMSWGYGRAVQAADREIGAILASADRAFGAGQYTVIVTADHGGHGRDHGSDDPRDVLIPWIAWGKGVTPNQTLPDGIRTVDTAATALAFLGVQTPVLAGRAVAGAFQQGLPALAGVDGPEVAVTAAPTGG